jgi:hypothetical protein
VRLPLCRRAAAAAACWLPAPRKYAQSNGTAGSNSPFPIAISTMRHVLASRSGAWRMAQPCTRNNSSSSASRRTAVRRAVHPPLPHPLRRQMAAHSPCRLIAAPAAPPVVSPRSWACTAVCSPWGDAPSRSSTSAACSRYLHNTHKHCRSNLFNQICANRSCLHR